MSESLTPNPQPRPVGPPTILTDQEMIDIAKAYMLEVQARDITDDIPTMQELALKMHYDGDTLVERAKTCTELSATIKELKTLHLQRLTTGGLKGKLNPTMCIFLMKANYGMVETSRTELTGKDGKDIIPILGGVTNAIQTNDSNQEAS